MFGNSEGTSVRLKLSLLCACMVAAVLAVGCGEPTPVPPPPQESDEAESARRVVVKGKVIEGTPLDQARQIVDIIEADLSDDSFASIYDRHFASYDLAEATELAPDFAPAHSTLGRALLLTARYGEAAESFRRALELDDTDVRAREGLREAERLAALVDSLPISIGPDQVIFRLAEVRLWDRPGVFILMGSHDPATDGIIDAEVRYFVWEDSTYREAFRSNSVAGVVDPWGPRGVRAARIWVGDFQRVGRTHIILVMGDIAASCAPSWVDVFEVHGETLTQVLHVHSHDVPARVDLDEDGRPEVQVEYEVGGESVPGAGMGIWHDVYWHDGRRYIRANSRFPKLCRQNLEEMLWKVSRYPEDSEPAERVAQAYRDLGDEENATIYEQRAEQLKDSRGEQNR